MIKITKSQSAIYPNVYVKKLILFQRGRIDTFGIELLDIGELSKITIGHDGAGFGSGWFLDNVVVRDETLRNREYKFQCGRWLDKVCDAASLLIFSRFFHVCLAIFATCFSPHFFTPILSI
jgi:hypothetical protein